ncbi:MAG: lysophospholipid acyltransferase family protein [Bacteroidales bacterium]|nr:lysophospholipid acyltransferase family protein [Bacteroidales bacterium]
MKRILYTPLGWLLKALALLPLWVLYRFADVIFFLVWHVVGYRKKVVIRQLTDAYPDKTPREIKLIARRFFRNFADYIVETVKLLHISDAEMRRRFTFSGLEAMDTLIDRDIPIMVLFSHCFNWEWAPSVTLWLKHKPGQKMQFGQVYRPLKNKWMDSLMLRIRSRFNSVNYPMKQVLRELLTAKRDGIHTATGFMSDQKPIYGDVRHVIDFLNHPTPTLLGSAELASKLHMGAVYWDIRKLSRGHYHIDMIHITDDAALMTVTDLTDRYFELLSATIDRDPAIWLWSHKRWKYPYKFAEDGTPIYDSKSVR